MWSPTQLDFINFFVLSTLFLVVLSCYYLKFLCFIPRRDKKIVIMLRKVAVIYWKQTEDVCSDLWFILSCTFFWPRVIFIWLLLAMDVKRKYYTVTVIQWFQFNDIVMKFLDVNNFAIISLLYIDAHIVCVVCFKNMELLPYSLLMCNLLGWGVKLYSLTIHALQHTDI